MIPSLQPFTQAPKPFEIEKVQYRHTLTDHYFPMCADDTYHIYILCHSGHASFKLDHNVFHIVPDTLTFWSIRANVHEVEYSPSFDAEILLISRRLLLETNPNPILTMHFFMYIRQWPVIYLDETEIKLIQNDFSHFKTRFALEQPLFGYEIFRCLTTIFVYDIYQIHALESDKVKIVPQTGNLFYRFMEAVRQNVLLHRDVAYYAELLCISPKYLSEVVNRDAGKSASYWIKAYAMQAIVAQLKDETLSLTQIAEKMNFLSLSHFTRYVKEGLGVSPSAYRHQINSGKSNLL